MVERRIRDLGSMHYANPEMLVAFAILGILVALAVQVGMKILESKDFHCVQHLVQELDSPSRQEPSAPRAASRMRSPLTEAWSGSPVRQRKSISNPIPNSTGPRVGRGASGKP
jgi:Tfp pilus assembly protein FimT